MSSKLTKNFALSEFRCKDGSDVPAEHMDNVEELQYALEKGNNWWSIVNSLTGVVKGVDEDITNNFQV